MPPLRSADARHAPAPSAGADRSADPPPADPIAAVTAADPYPYYRALATRDFHRDASLGLWIAASAADVAAVLSHPACVVRPVAQPVPPALCGTPAGALFGALIRMNEGPAHQPLKRIVLTALAQADAADIRPRAAAMSQLLDDPHTPAAVNRWLAALPVLTLADWLGFDARGEPAVAAHVAAFAAAMSPLAGPDAVVAGADSALWLGHWLNGQRFVNGPAHAIHTTAVREGVAPEAIAGNLIGLLVQTCEATAALAGNLLLALGRSPAGSHDLAALAERTARDDPPVQNTRRFLAEDATVCGVPLRAGDTILVVLAAASHDPASQTSAPPTFGAGRHACPGDALALTLASATTAALLARGADPATLVRAFRYRPSVNARIPEFL